MKPRISLTMIGRNGEATLPRALATTADLVDEIVFVDTGSTDGTRELAAAARDRHGRPSRLFDFAWCDDFSAALAAFPHDEELTRLELDLAGLNGV